MVELQASQYIHQQYFNIIPYPVIFDFFNQKSVLHDSLISFPIFFIPCPTIIV